MTPSSRLPYRAKRIAARVGTRRIDKTGRDEAMRRDKTKRNGERKLYRPVGMTPHSAGEYGTRRQNDQLDARNS